EHSPHAAHILFRVAPVALGVEIPELEKVECAQLDSGHGIGDLSSHELQTAERRLVVEQNAAASKDAIALTVVDRHPVGVELCHTIGTAGIERGQLVLGNRLCLPEHFRSTGLVEANTTVNYSDCL